MNKTDIKRVITELVPDKEMECRLSEKILKKKHNKLPLKPIVSIAASIGIVISIGIFYHNFLEKKLPNSAYSIDTKDTKNNVNTADSINTREGIYIPKIELPQNSNADFASSKLIGLIVYKGRIYTGTGSTVNAEKSENLLDEKLGTANRITDSSEQQHNSSDDLVSTIGKQDVYSVKGYDKDFRIMTYEKTDGIIRAHFYECVNGITVKTGADIFNKLKIEKNIKSAKYSSFENWDYNAKQYKELKNLQVINDFADKLKFTIPYSEESLSYLRHESEENQKFLYLSLNDGTNLQLKLFKEGYVYYNYSPVYFKMENNTFNKLWEELK